MYPERFGTLTGNVRLNKYLNLNAYLLYRGGWVRNPNDTRDDPGELCHRKRHPGRKKFSQGAEGSRGAGSGV